LGLIATDIDSVPSFSILTGSHSVLQGRLYIAQSVNA
jgi:hypothetical protein